MISFSEITDSFKNNCISCRIQLDNTSIDKVKALEKGLVFESNTIYVGYVSTINHLPSVRDLNLILIGDEELKIVLNCNYLIIGNINNIYEIINNIEQKIKTSMDSFNEPSKLISAFLNDNDINALCQNCAKYINNPLILTDTSYNILSYSHHDDMQDEVWRTGTKRGNLTYEFISVLTGDISDHFESDGSRMVYIADNISKNRRKIYKCHLNNVFLGYLIILEYYHDFSIDYNKKEQLALQLISKQLSIKDSYFQVAYKKQEISLISDLLNDKISSRIVYNTRYNSTFLKEFSYFQFISIAVGDYFFDDGSQGKLKTELEKLNDVLLLAYEQNIVILNMMKTRVNRNHEALCKILNRNKLTAGASNVFSDLYSAHNYYLQSLDALRFNAMSILSGPVYSYNDISFYQLISNISQSQLESYCCQNVVDIYRDDLKNNTSNLDTLYNYFRYGKNITQTARHMFVHRNTINYRISNIKDVYELNLDDADAVFTYYFSTLILKYISFTNDQKIGSNPMF